MLCQPLGDDPEVVHQRAEELVAGLLADEHRDRLAGPSPKTVCVALRHRGTPGSWQLLSAGRRATPLTSCSLVSGR